MKGKIKRVMALLLSLIMVLTMLPATVFAAAPNAPTNPRWDGYVAKWDAVDGAEEYELHLWRGSFGFFGTTTSNTQYDVSAYMAPGQTYSFSAYAIKGSEKSADATSAEITVPGSLGTISGIAWDGYTLRWDAVTNAVSYNVKLYKDDVQVATGNSVPATSYDFTSDIAGNGDGVYYARVEADYYVFGNTMATGESGEITVGTPKIKIDTIEATLSVPVAGQNAGALELTVPAGSHYTATIESVEGYADLTATTFAAGESYSGRILLTPNEGYRFAYSPTVQFDNVGYFSHMSTNTSTGAYEYAITFSCPGHGVAASISDVDFGTLAVGYSEVDAKNPTVTNTGTEVFNLGGAYAKVALTARDVTAFTCGWNSGGGAINVGGSSNSKPWVRPVTGLPAGTYTATLTLYYDYDASGTDYDWEVMDTATVTLTVAADVPTTYTVSFNASGGSGTMADVTGVSGDYVLPDCTFTPPSGKQFAGWSVYGNHYAAGDTLYSLFRDITAYAVWEDIPAFEIDTIEATLSVPVAGQNAGALTLTVPAGSNYTATIESVEGNEVLTATTFAAGESYSGRVIFTPNEGYRFEDSPTVQIDNVGYFSHMATNGLTGAYEYAITFSCPGHGVTVSGVATSFLSDTDTITIQLIEEGKPEAAYEATVTGNSATYTINDVVAGTYTLKVMKANHVTREYEVVVGTEAVELNVKICPKGDVNLDGEVNADDLTALARHVAKIETLDDPYALLCSDVDDNGSQSADDLTKLARYVAKIINTLD